MKKQFFHMVFVFVLATACYGHDNKVIHPYVLSGQAKDVLISNTGGATKPSDSPYYIMQTYFNDDESSLDEDKRSRIRNGTRGTIEADVPITKTVNHFYNPVTHRGGAGTLGGASAINYGNSFWTAAIEKYNDGGAEETAVSYWNLGNVLHLLQDMTSVPHVYNDAHVFETDDYEDWVKENINDLLSGNDITQASASAYPWGTSNLSYDDFLHEAALKTFNSAKVMGNLTKNATTPCVGDLAQMFPAEGQSALAYMSYVDSGIEEHWTIISANDSYYYANAFVSNSWWPIRLGEKDINYLTTVPT